jgi:hypothetical protein
MLVLKLLKNSLKIIYFLFGSSLISATFASALETTVSFIKLKHDVKRRAKNLIEKIN